jgi:hypothetical protein
MINRKYTMSKVYKHIALLLLSIIVCINFTFSQDPLFTYIEFSTWKYNNDERGLKTKVISEDEDGEFGVPGLRVNYFVFNNEDFEFVAEAVTNADGVAEALFPPDYNFPKDEEGYILVKSAFDGNEMYDLAEEELSFKDANFEFQFDIVDEEKLILFEGIILDKNNEPQVLADDDIYFYVPRMFSYLKIADGWFEENGKGYIEFPDDIIGDSLGQVIVYGRIEDHYDYGNIEKYALCEWAVPMHPHLRQQPGRELWTPIAPLWMIITLIITLTGVWGHYIYAIVQLNRIKRLARKNKV